MLCPPPFFSSLLFFFPENWCWSGYDTGDLLGLSPLALEGAKRKRKNLNLQTTVYPEHIFGMNSQAGKTEFCVTQYRMSLLYYFWCA